MDTSTMCRLVRFVVCTVRNAWRAVCTFEAVFLFTLTWFVVYVASALFVDTLGWTPFYVMSVPLAIVALWKGPPCIVLSVKCVWQWCVWNWVESGDDASDTTETKAPPCENNPCRV